MTKTPPLTGKSKTALTLPAFQRKWEHSWSNQGEDLLCVVTIHKPKITGPPNSQKTWRTESRKEKKMHLFHGLENIRNADRALRTLRANYCTKSKSPGPFNHPLSTPDSPLQISVLSFLLLCLYCTEIGQILAWPWKSVSHSWSLSLLMCKMWRINGTSQVVLLSTGGCTWHDATCVGNTQNKFLFFYSEKQLLSSGSSSSVVLWSCICCLNWLNLHHHP